MEFLVLAVPIVMNKGETMPQPTDTAIFVLKAGEHTVTRNQIVQAMDEFDRKSLRDKPSVGDNRKGWFIEGNGKRYNPKWILKLATDTPLGEFTHKQAKETLSALGFKPHRDPYCQGEGTEDHRPLNDDNESQEADESEELTFDKERYLQAALRANIEQLEAKLEIIDGGKERTVEYGGAANPGRIDITAKDDVGAIVVIELKAGEAGRHAIGQILGYMGALAPGSKPTRGILVAEDFSPQAKAAASAVPGLQLRKYNFKFAFEIVGAA
jgi:hypothetical protein